MNKIIAAFDGLKYAESTAAYAADIARRHQARVVGVFLEDFTYHSYKLVDLLEEDDVDQTKAAYLNKMDVETRDSAVSHFEAACREAGVQFSVHRDKNIAIQELLHESIYADLIIIQNNETLTHYTEQVPSNFISGLLERTECPVLLVPSVFQKTEKIIFLFDGEPGSVFAMKQFAAVFPGEDVPIDLVCVRREKETGELPDKPLIREWVKLHYPQAEYIVMQGDAKTHITEYIREDIRNTLVVLGAYQRGGLSRFLHSSMADALMTKLNIPVFIAHK